MIQFGKKKKKKQQEPTPEVGTEDQNEGLQTYMMDPSLQETHDLMQAVLAEAEQVVMGKRPILDLTAVGILAGGNILFEDNPGLAKTLLANTFAQALGINFKRVQFTPDLLPADITGIYIWNQKDQKFEFRKGPLFCNLLLADEINRAPPKTQAALLEAMQEHQVTIGETSYQLERPFLVLATQNPIEQEGTYPLPEAQVDRFMLKVVVDYPKLEEEQKIINMNLSSHDGEYIKIFDKEIGLYYTPDFYIFDNDDEYLHAVAVSESKGLRSLKFDKSIKYLQWTALSSSGGTTVHFGFCK